MKAIDLKGLIITSFVISWIGIAPSILISHGFEIPAYLKPLELLMTFGTLIAALVYTFRANGRKGVKVLFSKFLKLRATLAVLLVALVFPILSAFLGAYFGLELAQMSWPDRYTQSFILQQGIQIFIMYLILNTEEIAWRGVVFDQLFTKYGFIKACLILFPIWWLFHLPYFFHASGHPAGYGVGIFSILVLAQTFILGWIYVKSNRSLFYSHVSHQLTNSFAEAFPLFPIFIGGSIIPLFTFSMILMLMALIIILGHFVRKKRQKRLEASAHT